METQPISKATNETTAQRWERWNTARAGADPSERPLRTIHEQRRLAQRASVNARRRARRREKREKADQIRRDREARAAGRRFIATYQPPAVASLGLPAGTVIVDAAEYRVRHEAAYRDFSRNIMSAAYMAAHHRHLDFWNAISVEAGGAGKDDLRYMVHVNVSALQAVTSLLGRGPLWVYWTFVSWAARVRYVPPRDRVWNCLDAFVLALGPRSLVGNWSQNEPQWRDGRDHHEGALFFLNPLCLAGHADRMNPGGVAPREAILWQRVLDARPLVALTGLPLGIDLKSAVRRLVRDWAQEEDRKYPLPWQSQNEAALAETPADVRSEPKPDHEITSRQQ